MIERQPAVRALHPCVAVVRVCPVRTIAVYLLQDGVRSVEQGLGVACGDTAAIHEPLKTLNEVPQMCPCGDELAGDLVVADLAARVHHLSRRLEARRVHRTGPALRSPHCRPETEDERLKNYASGAGSCDSPIR